MHLYTKHIVNLSIAHAFGLQPTGYALRDFCGKVSDKQLTLEVKAMRLRHKTFEIRKSLVHLSHRSRHGIGTAKRSVMGEIGAVKTRVAESAQQRSRSCAIKPARATARQHEAMAIWSTKMRVSDPKAAADEPKPATTDAAVLCSGSRSQQRQQAGPQHACTHSLSISVRTSTKHSSPSVL